MTKRKNGNRTVEVVTALKRRQLTELAERRDRYRKNPELTWLFFEVTNRCNLRCLHCGSSCTAGGQDLSAEDVRKVLASVASPDDAPMICLTGGEPLLHPHFFDIAATVSGMGFYWGMTTNGTLIDARCAAALRDTGMSTVTVSLDGMEGAHDALRRSPGAWHDAMEGIRCLQEAGFSPQVTTVVHRENMQDLDLLYETLVKTGIRFWRIINIEPIGRACESGDLMLDKPSFQRMLQYIQDKRYDRTCPMEVTYGCSHYLGVRKERMVRDQYFMCGAGIFVASVRSNGDICGCLDIENRPELVQGNIHRDSFAEVWKNRFEAFRRDRTEACGKCRECPDRYLCGGDAMHTWDFDRQQPLLCGMEMCAEDIAEENS